MAIIDIDIMYNKDSSSLCFLSTWQSTWVGKTKSQAHLKSQVQVTSWGMLFWMFFQAAPLNFLVTLESSQSVGRLVIASIALNLRACMYHSDTSDNITFLWHIRPASLHESHRYDNLDVARLNS